LSPGLRLGETILEVPISAMLILLVDTRPRPPGGSSRRSSARPGGLAAGFVLARPKAESAEEAIADLGSEIADLLGRLAFGWTAWAGFPCGGG
jgi:hypothetical protein